LVSIVCLLHALRYILFFSNGERDLVGATRSLLALNGGLLTHGSKDDDVYMNISILLYGLRLDIRTGVLLLVDKELPDLGANLVVGALDVVLAGAVLTHEGHEVVITDVELRKSCQRSAS